MDSQVTLVNPIPAVSYYLSSTDLTDTVIFTEPAVPLYRVTGDERHIKIYDGTAPDRLIAILHRRDILCDTISFPSRSNATRNMRMQAGKQMTIPRWLKRSKMPDGTATFKFNTEYGQYIWKVTSKYCLKVFAEYDLHSPVASCFLYHTLPPSQPALVLQASGEPVRDDIIVAYLVQRYRVMLESKTLDLFVGPYQS